MDPCETYDCVQQQFTLELSTVTDSGGGTEEENDANSFSFTTKILIPIVLIFGIFIVVAIGLIIQRIIVAIARKRRNFMLNGRHRSPNGAENGSNLRSEISSISRNSGLPSYGQVMAAIEREDAPPSYFKVSMGAVNFSFTGDYGIPHHVQPSIEQITGQAIGQVVVGCNASQQHDPNQCPAGEGSLGTDAQVSEESSGEARVGTTPTCNHVSSVQHNEVDGRNTSTATHSTASGSEIPFSVEAQVPIVIHNIDEIIDSISVPSTLPPGSIRKKRTQRNNKTQNNNVEECTSFSSVPCRACIPGGQPITACEQRIGLESTPV